MKKGKNKMNTIISKHRRKENETMTNARQGANIIARSVLVAGFLFTTNSFAVDRDVGNASTSYTDDLRNQSGTKQQKITGGKVIVDQRGQVDDNFYDTVVYDDIWSKRSHGDEFIEQQMISRGKVGSIALALPATELAQAELEAEKKWQAEEAERTKKEEEEAKKIPSYYVGGYCSVNTPVKIVRNSEFTILNCLLNFGEGEYRHADVFAGVYPNYKKETLTVLPLYATLESGKKVSIDGVVLTSDKGSLNIADHIERYTIRKLVAEYGLAINDVAYRYANAFMSQLILSRTRTNVDYVSVSDPANPNNTNSVVPVVTQNTLPPQASDYFIMAGIELFSQLFAIGAKDLMSDSEPLFRIFKGKRVYLEGIVTADNKGMAKKFGIITDATKKNIDADNAKYDQEKQKLIDRADQTLMRSSNTGGMTQGGLETITQGYQQTTGTQTTPTSAYSR